jgi:hypothetical protein
MNRGARQRPWPPADRVGLTVGQVNLHLRAAPPGELAGSCACYDSRHMDDAAASERRPDARFEVTGHFQVSDVGPFCFVSGRVLDGALSGAMTARSPVTKVEVTKVEAAVYAVAETSMFGVGPPPEPSDGGVLQIRGWSKADLTAAFLVGSVVLVFKQ